MKFFFISSPLSLLLSTSSCVVLSACGPKPRTTLNAADQFVPASPVQPVRQEVILTVQLPPPNHQIEVSQMAAKTPEVDPCH